MRKLNFDSAALLWLGLGATLLSLVVLQGSITPLLAIPPLLWRIALIFGVITSLWGVTLALLSQGIKISSPAQAVLEQVVLRHTDTPRVITHAQSRDIPKLWKLYRDEFGDDIPTQELMSAWLTRYPHAFVLFHEEVSGLDLSVRRRFVGSVKILPITLAACTELEAGRTSGSTLKPEHICDERDAAGFYVGDVFAYGWASRAAVLYHLDMRCRELVARGYTIYARPFTRQGRTAMIKREFVQVSNGSRSLEMRQLCRLEPSMIVRKFTPRKRMKIALTLPE